MAKRDVEKYLKYTYRVQWSEKDREHVGLCAEFPSLSWLALKADEALRGIVKLVREAVDDMVKSKEPVPEPMSLQQFSGKILVRVPPEQHRALAIEAAEQKVSMNRLISRKLSA